MTNIEGQCQLATNVVTTKDIILGQSIQNALGYVIVYMFVILAYTVTVFLIGYKFGVQNGQCKMTMDKMTMTPVTYTFVRGVKEPRFEFHPPRLTSSCRAKDQKGP